MRRFAASVTIVTAVDERGRPHGMAASAVTSVSVDPPSMLVAVNRAASLHPVLARAAHFCINVLGSDQLDVVERFSRSDLRDRRFELGRWVTGTAGLPRLADGRSAIFCRMDRIVDYATHSLHLGVVIDVADGEASLPLVWLNGSRAEITSAAR
ncbi:MAG TPA: flavin reductase family protein [Dongiaceae bacterium]|nr:flavin reductase family protein [Dongiaceae bacterium]